MAKVKNRFLVVTVLAIFFVIWNILVFVCADLDSVGKVFWGAYAFTVFAFLLTGAAICVMKFKSNVNFSTLFPLYLVTSVYFAIAFLVNLIIMLAFGDVNKLTATVVINVIVLLIAVAAFIMFFMGSNHVAEVRKEVYTKVGNLRMLGATVGSLQYSVKDEEVRKKIRALQESIRYSSPSGNQATAQIEQDVESQVEIIKSLVASGAPSADIIDAVEQAIGLVKSRNALLMASR